MRPCATSLPLGCIGHRDFMCRRKRAGAADDFDLALLRHHRQSAGETADDLALPFAQLRDVDLRLAETDAGNVHLFGFLDHLRRVQQRLRRNAADIQADTAERRPALDQRYLHAEIGGTEGCGIAARAGTEHDDVEVVSGRPLETRARDSGFGRGWRGCD